MSIKRISEKVIEVAEKLELTKGKIFFNCGFNKINFRHYVLHDYGVKGIRINANHGKYVFFSECV